MGSRRSSWVEEFFRIQLSNPDGVVHAGKVLSGKLCLNLRSPLRNGLIRMALIGKGRTSWKEQEEEGRKGKVIRLADEETVMHQPVSFWDREIREEMRKDKLEPGLHTFPFEIQIPLSCPSSYEGRHGQIQYFCKAIISKPLKMDHEVQVPFTVIGRVDLNKLTPSVFQPITETRVGREKNGVRCQLSLSRSGYVPGEVIAIFAKIHNDSKDSVVGGVKAILRQNVTFRGKTKSGAVREKRKGFIVEEVCKREQIEPGNSQEWANEGLKVPSTPPSFPDNKALLSIEYEVEFVVSSSIRILIPIFIGSSPGYRDLPRPAVPLPPSQALRGQSVPMDRRSVWEIMKNTPPPAYEECMLDGGGREPEEGNSPEGADRRSNRAHVRPSNPNTSRRRRTSAPPTTTLRSLSLS